jgi:ABC-type lipoprotein export system ATPase subunit
MMTKKENYITCKGLYKIFKVSDLEVVALRGVELEVKRGEVLAIVGASGSGKSTLLNILAGYDFPSAGSVEVGEYNLIGMVKKEIIEYRRSEVGFIWQQTSKNLLSYLTVQDNIELPMLIAGVSKNKKERVEEIISTLDLKEIAKRYPKDLSGGEQQIVAIGVALSNSPSLLLADEPTGELDDNTGKIVLESLKKVNKNFGTTVLIVTHDPGIKTDVERLVSMRDGKTASEVFYEDVGEKENEYLIIDSFGEIQLPQEILEKSDLTNRAQLKIIKGSINLEKSNND